MGEQVAKTASNLLPLLAVLLGIFGVLILLAVLLRARVRSESASSRRKRSAWQPEGGEPCSVLGRAYTMQAVFVLPDGGRLVELRADDAEARLLAPPAGESLWYFPGTLAIAQAAEFPEELTIKEQKFVRQGEPAAVSALHRIAAYRAGEELLLLVEVRGDKASVWRGKCIPREGFGPLER